MNEQRRKHMLQVAIEQMTKTRLHEQFCNHWPIEAQSSHIVFFSEWYFIIESILRQNNMRHAPGYSEAISYQVKMMVNDSPLTKGKYDYSKEWKGVDATFIYNTKTLLPLTFDEQTDKKGYASTGNRTHDQE